VVTVSMAVDNGALLQLLCRRRELEAHLKTNIEGRAWLEVLFLNIMWICSAVG
jgi:hypothetical protein